MHKAPPSACAITGALLVAFMAASGLAEPATAAADPGPAASSDRGLSLSDPLARALAPAPGGLEPDTVARRAVRTSHSVASKQAELRAAAAQVDQARVGFFPVVSTSFGYSRLSPVENSLDLGISIPGTDMSAFSFPVINNSYSWDTQRDSRPWLRSNFAYPCTSSLPRPW